MTATGLIYVALPRATCGLTVTDGKVTDAPPYLRRRTVGRDARQVWRELHRQAERIEWIPDETTHSRPRGGPNTSQHDAYSQTRPPVGGGNRSNTPVGGRTTPCR